jgi:hypothetical protein
MRATDDDTVLDGCFVPDKYVARVVDAGPAGLDLFVLSIFAWGLVAFGNVYCGLAQRARDLTLDMLKKKKSMAVTRTMAYHPEAQHGVAEMVMALETVEPLLDRVAEEWAEGRDYGPGWVLKIVTAKYQAVEAAFRVTDTALDLSGGYGMFKTSELERLFRDSRAGRFHPANSALTHELVAKLSLGIDPGCRDGASSEDVACRVSPAAAGPISMRRAAGRSYVTLVLLSRAGRGRRPRQSARRVKAFDPQINRQPSSLMTVTTQAAIQVLGRRRRAAPHGTESPRDWTAPPSTLLSRAASFARGWEKSFLGVGGSRDTERGGLHRRRAGTSGSRLAIWS